MPNRPGKHWRPTGWHSAARGQPIIQYALDLPIGHVATVYRERTAGCWRWKFTDSASQRMDGTDTMHRSAAKAAEECEAALIVRLSASLVRLRGW